MTVAELIEKRPRTLSTVCTKCQHRTEDHALSMAGDRGCCNVRYCACPGYVPSTRPQDQRIIQG